LCFIYLVWIHPIREVQANNEALSVSSLSDVLTSAPGYDSSLFSGLKYRMIGPYRGGRSTEVTGVAGKPNTFYMGTTGGVYKSTDGGRSLSFVGLKDAGVIGQVAVHPGDPEVAYVAAVGHPVGPNKM